MRKNGTFHPCVTCGKQTYRAPSSLKRKRRVFCSRKCYETWWSQNIPGRYSGSDHYGWKGGKIEKVCPQCGSAYFVDRNKMAKDRKYCSLKCRGSAYSGPNSHWWKGGISKERDQLKATSEYRNWKWEIHRRDHMKCVLCLRKQRTVKLHAHHIIPISMHPELATVVGNGVTLCSDCHRQTYKNEVYFMPVLLSRILRDDTPDSRMPIILPKIESDLHGDMQRAAEMTAPVQEHIGL